MQSRHLRPLLVVGDHADAAVAALQGLQAGLVYLGLTGG
jgi:hypothetical protein